MDAYQGGRTQLTKFDRLAVWICVLGSGVMAALHIVLVPSARSVYSDVDDLIRGLTKIVMAPGYGAASVMLMLFLAYYGARMRRAYNNQTASNVLFLGIVFSLATNGLLIWALYTPAGRSMQYLG
ncbi:MAG: hypothetical protein AAGE52_08335 [Myxococcota bacterium]